MAELSDLNVLFDIETTGEEVNGLFKSELEVMRQLPGSVPSTTMQINNDILTPTQSFHLVDGEAETEIDDLRLIDPANTNDGMELRLQAVPGRTITVMHNPTAVNGIRLLDGKDMVLSDTAYLCLKRSGTSWIEIASGSSATATETAKGGGYLATQAEAESGVTGDGRVALMTPERVFQAALTRTEFAQFNTYSSDEWDTGKRRADDGRVIYAKEIYLGKTPSNSGKTVLHNIDKLDTKTVRDHAWYYSPSAYDGAVYDLNFVSISGSEAKFSYYVITTTYIALGNNNASLYGNFDAWCYMEYSKTA